MLRRLHEEVRKDVRIADKNKISTPCERVLIVYSVFMNFAVVWVY